MRKLNKKGFTLAELLIVVAIIAVLTAIAIPVFTAQLKKAKYATDEANARSLYAELSADYLASGGQDQTSGKVKVNGSNTTSLTINGEAQDVAITIDEVPTNTYKFTGTANITINLGTDSQGPSVHIEADSTLGMPNVDWGAGAVSGS